MRCEGAIHRVEDFILALLLTAMILLASAQIVLRNLFDSSLFWGDPLLPNFGQDYPGNDIPLGAVRDAG